MTDSADKNLYQQLSAELEKTQQQVEELTRELQEAKEKLHQLVFRDGLTGLYNRRYFEEMIRKELDRSLRYNSPFSMVVFELDDFDRFQQNYGSANGELILMNTARVVDRVVRPCDIAARFSDDQFAVILPETDLAEVKSFADRLREDLAELATLIDGEEIKCSITLGGASYNPQAPEVTISDFVMTAERALTNAKKDGANQTRIMLISVRQDD